MGKSELAVFFRIVGFECSPAEVTSALQITPTGIWLKGEKRHAKGILVHNENCWELRSTLSHPAKLVDHVQELVSKLAPLQKVLAGLDTLSSKQLCCSLSIYGDDRPEISLPPSILRAICDLGAGLDIDLIVYPEG